MGAVEKETLEGVLGDIRCQGPSVFGLYDPLILDGPGVAVDIGERVMASMGSGAGRQPRLRMVWGEEAAELDLQIARDTEELRNALLSRWMKECYRLFPDLPLEGVLAMIVSQAAPTPNPVWLNARIKYSQWESILAHALETLDPYDQSERIVAGLALHTDLLQCLRGLMPVASALIGIEPALERLDPSCVGIVRQMVHQVAEGEGLLVASDRGQDAAAEARIRDAIASAGWLALVGKRPLEVYASDIAASSHTPAIVLDSDKMKTSAVLGHVDRIITIGDEGRLGVMRRRAIEMAGGLKEK